jgi:1,4-alpha-glucan branching enzyme
MGKEFAQRNEWTEGRSLDWHLLDYDSHRGIKKLVADLNRLHAQEPALHQVDFDWTGFEWIDCNDGDSSVLSFIRRGRNSEDFVVAILNATPVVRGDYRVGVPAPGFYKELMNTDATIYGGSGVGNLGGVRSDDHPVQGRPHSLLLTLPPLAALIFKPQP